MCIAKPDFLLKAFFAVIVLSALMLGMPSHAQTIKIATVSPDGLDWMKKMRAGAKEVAERTDGRVKFKIYPGGVQGDDITVLRKMRIGQLQGGVMASSTLTRFYPDLQVYSLPLVFRDQHEVDYVRERMDQQIINGLADGGMVSFSLTETGFAYMLTNEPVASIEDLKKVKAWVPEGDPVSANLTESFGISPIPLSLPDVLAGLQTGLIDAVAVPPVVALALQWHNQVKYVTRLPLLYIYSMLALDKKAFDKMSDADQAIVTEVMNRVFEDVDSTNRDDNKRAYDALINQGIKEVTLTPAQLEAWRAQADASVAELVIDGEISAETVNTLRAELQAVREAKSADAAAVTDDETGSAEPEPEAAAQD